MTLLEIMIVLAIIGLLLTLGVRTLMNVRASDLREETNKVLAVLRIGYNQASATGKHVRAVFDLDEQKFWLEQCAADMRMKQRDDNEDGPTEEERAEELVEVGEKVQRVQEQLRQSGQSSDQLAQVLQANSPEQAVEVAAALEGKRLGAATCEQIKDPLLAARNQSEEIPIGVVRKDKGIRISKVMVKHLLEPVEEGRVTVNFFPLGFAERAIVELRTTSGDDVYTLLVHATTGKVEIRSEELDDPEDFMMRNAVGDREEEREQ